MEASATTRQATTISDQCKICGASSKYSSYGVLSCRACKMFFKRNAEKGLEALKCDLDDQCEINFNSRHTCSYCRLRKCFASGMQIEMIRGPQAHPRRKKQPPGNPTPVRPNEVEQFPTLNLLQADHSSLTMDQWNLISNISHCYDEHSALSIGEKFLREQNALPMKMRFKCGPTIEFFRAALDRTPSLYQKNQDFLSLSNDDRLILLENTFPHTGVISTCLIYHHIGLFDYSTFYDAIALATSPTVASAVKHIRPLYNFDMIVMKLFLAILSFSTTTCSFFSNAQPKHLSNTKQILAIQDSYTEILWRYLLYKHGSKKASIYFLDLIRHLFFVHTVVVLTQEVQWFTEEIVSHVEHIKGSVTLT